VIARGVLLAAAIGACGRGDFGARLDACVIADSVADFSSMQGTNGWTYGYAQAGVFQLFPSFGTDPDDESTYQRWYETVGPGGYWTSLWVEGGHPNGTNGNAGRLPIAQHAVRRWTAASAAQLSVSVAYAAEDVGTMNVEVDLDGVAQFFATTASPGSAQVTVTVQPGSNLDFTIAAPNDDDSDGSTRFTAMIGCGS
jgi:hypothetical protein